MSSQLLDTSACQIQMVSANRCLQTMPLGECSCIENTSTFVTDYPLLLQRQFVETQAFMSEIDPAFCDTASDRMCEYFQQNNSCCCEMELQTYRICLFDKVLVPAFPPIAAGNTDCKDSCDFQTFNMSNGGDDGNNMLFIAAGAGALVALLVAIGVYLRCCRKSRNEDPAPPKEVATIPAGNDEDRTDSDNDSHNSPRHANRQPAPKPKYRSSPPRKVAEDYGDDEEIALNDASHPPKRPEDRGVDVHHKKSSKEAHRHEEAARAEFELEAREKLDRLKAKEKKYKEKYTSGDDEGGPSSEKLERLRAKQAKIREKQAKIRSWRDERRKGSSRSLEEYLSDEGFDA